jgi:hypothetical protein
MWLRMMRLYSVYDLASWRHRRCSTINAVPRQSFVIHPNGGWWQSITWFPCDHGASSRDFYLWNHTLTNTVLPMFTFGTLLGRTWQLYDQALDSRDEHAAGRARWFQAMSIPCPGRFLSVYAFTIIFRCKCYVLQAVSEALTGASVHAHLATIKIFT